MRRPTFVRTVAHAAVTAIAVGTTLAAGTAQAAGTTSIVESSPHDVLVNWGSHVEAAQAAAAAGLLDGVDNSGYLRGLAAEYPVSATATYIGAAIVRDSDLPATVDDSSIASTLSTGIAARTLPAPTGATNYVVMLPRGVSPANQSQQPSQVFCSSHAAFDANGKRAYVIVVSDYTDTAKQCSGTGSDPTRATTVNLSRQLVDTITDPESDPQGLHQTGTSLELGDACTASPTTGNVDGHAVQSWWSNAAGVCSVGTPGVAVVTDVNSVTNARAATFLLHDTDGSGPTTTFACTVDGTATSCDAAHPVSVTGLAAGTHHFRVTAQGVGQASFDWLIDLSPPVAAVTRPTAAITVGKTVTVSFAGTDPGSAGIAAYDVRYRAAAWNGGFGAWLQPRAWQGFGGTNVVMAVQPGHEYCFGVRAHDQAGNVQPSWSASRCTTVPVDDRMLVSSVGWRRVASPSSFRGTLTVGSKQGARLRLPGAHVRQVALLVRTCSTCGRVKLYRGGVFWRSVDTHSVASRPKVLIVLPAFALRTTTIWLVAAGAKPVYVDGVAIRRV